MFVLVQKNRSQTAILQQVVGSDHPRTDGYVVNNHGDRCRPQDPGVVGPLPNGLKNGYTWG